MNFDFQILSRKVGVFDSSCFDGDVAGRFDYIESGVEFECFLQSSKSEKMIVFLNSASYRKSENPLFHRVSWAGVLEDNLLYIEDPMYKKHEGLKCSWYYGDKDNSYLNYLVDIVENIANIKNIKNENIVFIGSSAGGYAAIFCANRLLGSKAYAYNPQIIPAKWPGSKKFNELTGIDLSGADSFYRNDISGFLNNTESKFFIHCNYFSSVDMVQLKGVLEHLEITNEGLYKKNNFFIALTPLNIRDNHICAVDKDDFIFALSVLFDEVDFLGEASVSYFRKFIDAARLKDKIVCANLWDGVLAQHLPDFLLMPNRSFKNRLDFECSDGLKVFYYRIMFDFAEETYKVIFYIQSKDKFEKSFVRKIEDIYCLCGYVVEYQEDRGFIRISLNVGETAEISKIFSEFCDRTYTKAYQLFNEYVINNAR